MRSRLTMKRHLGSLLIGIILLSFVISACQPQAGASTQTSVQSTPIPLAEVVFQVQIPSGTVRDNPSNVTAPTPSAPHIALEILDELTGLALNPSRYEMQPIDALHFFVRIPLPVGSDIRYRYIRVGDYSSAETTTDGMPVTYRLYHVPGAEVQEDIVSGWQDLTYAGEVGRFSGLVVSQDTNLPVPNAMVEIAGMQTYTSSDGSFVLEGVPVGLQTVVVYTVDGSHQIFQQGAVIAAGANTPAMIPVQPAHMVNITFELTTPESGQGGMPVRLIGNILQLGDSYTQQYSGMSIIPANAPVLEPTEDGKYKITLSLPAGYSLQYKYTLGDGFWNAEHSADGNFKIRHLIIPSVDSVITDSIEQWNSGEAAAVTFNVKVPDNTPVSDVVSIQFNPFGWMMPIPMVSLGNNEWMFTLFSPLDVVGDVYYRICRNNLCGIADDAATAGTSPAVAEKITPTSSTQNIRKEISAWAWGTTTASTISLEGIGVQGRGPLFAAGVEFVPEYSPMWKSGMSQAFQDIQSLGGNMVVFTPTWSVTANGVPNMQFAPSSGIFWQDLAQMVRQSQESGMAAALYPMLSYSMDSDQWWATTQKDDTWWNTWFERYREFVLTYADLANQNNASILILGDPSIYPALPGGKLSDGSSSGVPDSFDQKWQGLISEIRSRFNGQIYWALQYPRENDFAPTWLNQVDGLYLQFSAQLTTSSEIDTIALANEIGRILDTEYLPVVETTAKPVILALEYPSTNGSATGCIQTEADCLQFDQFNQPSNVLTFASLDLDEQASIYNAAFLSVNMRSWITGFVSRGFYPAVRLQDPSNSVYGKPASDVMKVWFPALKANPQ